MLFSCRWWRRDLWIEEFEIRRSELDTYTTTSTAKQSRQDALECCGYGSVPCATRNGNFDRLSFALMVPCAASSWDHHSRRQPPQQKSLGADYNDCELKNLPYHPSSSICIAIHPVGKENCALPFNCITFPSCFWNWGREMPSASPKNVLHIFQESLTSSGVCPQHLPTKSSRCNSDPPEK